jgi:hypothetical protein
MDGEQEVRRTFWRASVRARADLIEQQLNTYSWISEKDSAIIAEKAKDELQSARQATGPLIQRPLVRHWRLRIRKAATAEGAFVHLHTAEIMLTQLLPPVEVNARLPYVLARLRACFNRQQPQLLRVIEDEIQNCSIDSHRQAMLTNAMRAAYAVSDAQHARVRDFRNTLIVSMIVLAFIVAGVCAVGYVAPAAIPICFRPSVTAATPQPQLPTEQLACPAGKGHPAPGDVTLVALFGLLGGALSATVAIHRLRDTPVPYAVAVPLSISKLPFGALTAIVGLVMLHGQFVPGLSELDSQGQILAYAIILGVAQLVVTRFIDQRARNILTMGPDRDAISGRQLDLPDVHARQGDSSGTGN